MFSDLPNVFLFPRIAESVLAILLKYFFSKCKRPECGCPNCECPEYECPKCECSECKCLKVHCPSWCGPVCKVIYLLAMGALWSAALYVFLEEATTNKAETPDKSRNLNQDCIWGWLLSGGGFLITMTCGISCHLMLYL